MPCYERGNLSIEAYLVRILTGIVRQAGGELRVKGEYVDKIGEATTLIKEWDTGKGELVLRAGMHSFSEVFRVNPERQQAVEVSVPPNMEAPSRAAPKPEGNYLPKSSIFDNSRVSEIERKKQVAQAVALVREELRRRREAEA